MPTAVVSHSSPDWLEWGTQRLLTRKQSKKVTASQDDDSVGVLTENIRLSLVTATWFSVVRVSLTHLQPRS